MPRVIATLGPSSRGLEAQLAEAGAEAFRINASHVDLQTLEAMLAAARLRAPQVPMVVDLQGAKIRLGHFEPREVQAGQRLEVVLGETAIGSAIPLPHAEAFDGLEPGDAVRIDDGRVCATVLEARSGALSLLLQDSACLRPRKGFNRVTHPIGLRRLSARDEALVAAAMAQGCRWFALSFVLDGAECGWLRERGDAIHVTAKIETGEALSNLSAIAARADTLWICRGDLGAQIGELNLGRAVASVEPRGLGRPVYMAGQVLEHLTMNRQPTRSELCHLTELCMKGYAGVVLSDETAIGQFPTNAVAWAARLVRQEFGA